LSDKANVTLFTFKLFGDDKFAYLPMTYWHSHIWQDPFNQGGASRACQIWIVLERDDQPIDSTRLCNSWDLNFGFPRQNERFAGYSNPAELMSHAIEGKSRKLVPFRALLRHRLGEIQEAMSGTSDVNEQYLCAALPGLKDSMRQYREFIDQVRRDHNELRRTPEPKLPDGHWIGR